MPSPTHPEPPAAGRTGRLDEHDENEWRDVARHLRLGWSDAQIASAWEEFCHTKRPADVN